jgi:hypothetical protein
LIIIYLNVGNNLLVKEESNSLILSSRLLIIKN